MLKICATTLSIIDTKHNGIQHNNTQNNKKSVKHEHNTWLIVS
jgi:hypothetical protein